MNDQVLFLGGSLLAAIALTLLVFGSPKKAINYFSSKLGRKPLMGILTVFFVAIIAVLISAVFTKNAKADEQKGEWLAYGEMYFGADYTGELSPQCYEDGPNNRWTSNVGFRANLYQSYTKRFEANAKYTHHSCAFNQDRERYDSAGFELVIRLW